MRGPVALVGTEEGLRYIFRRLVGRVPEDRGQPDPQVLGSFSFCADQQRHPHCPSPFPLPILEAK